MAGTLNKDTRFGAAFQEVLVDNTPSGSPSQSVLTRTATLLDQFGAMLDDGAGRLRSNSEGGKATYTASALAQTPAATCTDLAVLPGSATKTIRVTRVAISGIATTAANIPVQLIKRSAADTAGTSSPLTAVPHDANDAVATAAPLVYTANPTLGAAVGNVRSARLGLGGGAVLTGPLVFDFTSRNERGIVLRGTAQQLAINLAGAALQAGQAMDVEFTWTEE